LHGHPTPVALSKLIMQMVEVDDSKRPASMAAVKQELQRIAAQIASGQFTTAPPSSSSQPARFSPPLGTVYGIHHGHSDSVRAISWSPDGTRIASCSWDNTVQVWDATTGDTLFTYRGHSLEVNAVAWSPDGSRVASGGNDHAVQVWQAE
jgi:WD40 repeat protein